MVRLTDVKILTIHGYIDGCKHKDNPLLE